MYNNPTQQMNNQSPVFLSNKVTAKRSLITPNKVSESMTEYPPQMYDEVLLFFRTKY